MISDTRYNKYKNCLINLKPGEEFCKKCHGDGIIISKRGYYPALADTKTRSLRCKECMGDGKVDWIEKATGKRIKTDTYGFWQR